jgi:hypothetical protein
MVQRLRENGIRDERVLAAMASVPRHLFVEEALASRAYEDTDLGLEAMIEEARQAISQLNQCNLLRLSRMALMGETSTCLGHDYAAGLWRGMRRGLVYLNTTNPALVGMAVADNPDYWGPIIREVKDEHPQSEPEGIAEMMTIKVVIENAQMLRPIWEISGGRFGLVSLQLSPKHAFEAKVMIAEALRIWAQLWERFGARPNVVFKVPGTAAGLEVAAMLTEHGIGVNITCAYSFSQQVAFAGVIEEHSHGQTCFRTQMDGRVDDPIGEELKAIRDNWAELKTWATTAIRQRDYGLLCNPPAKGGLGLSSSFCLGAAGRGPHNILRSTVLGPVPLCLTVFPTRQEEFDSDDSEPRDVNPNALFEPIPGSTLAGLHESWLFRRSYAHPSDSEGMKPPDFDTYGPLLATLKEFGEKYDNFVTLCASA